MEDDVSIDVKALYTKRFNSVEKGVHSPRSDLPTCKAAEWVSGSSSPAQLSVAVTTLS